MRGGLRILMTADAVGGVWSYAMELSRALRPHGAQIALATMGPSPSAAQRSEARRCGNVTLFESTFQLEWMADPWDDVHRAGDWLLDLHRRFKPDLVHLNGYAHAALPWQRPVIVVAHSCVLTWWQAVKNEPAPPQWNQYRAMVSVGMDSADLVVAPSQAMLDALRRCYGPLGESRVIYNGRSGASPAPAARQRLILSAGRLWDEAKNVALLDRVAPDLPWPVHVAGDEASLSGATASSQHLHHLGRLSGDELAQQFARASIYALPARYEPFGLTALEAALSGCALVLGAIESLREIWGDAALYAPPDDPDAWRQALRSLIEDSTRRHELAERARLRAARYTAARMADTYAALYRDVVRGNAVTTEAESAVG